MCKQWGIAEVVHFTHVENVDSIMKHGLLSIEDLQQKGILCHRNDQQRSEFVHEGVCLSISFPNYLMFCKYNDRNNNNTFVVISLKPSLLWELPCLFCPSNASSNEVKDLLTSDRASLMTFEAFKRMFDERAFRHSVRRSDLGIPKHYTTDPQAEVICLHSIDVSYITAIYHNGNLDNLNRWQNRKWGHLLRERPEFFEPRIDWKHWQSPAPATQT